MCRWHCNSTGVLTDLDCLHCGTRYCGACLYGEAGKMDTLAKCAHCNKPPRVQSSKVRKQWNCGPGSPTSRHAFVLSRDEIMDTANPLRLAFLCYASFGHPHVMEEMDGGMLQKWLREADMFDRKFTRTDLDLLFTKAVHFSLRSGEAMHKDHVRSAGLKRRLTYPQFLSMIPEIADRKGWSEEDVALVLEKVLPQVNVTQNKRHTHADAMWVNDQKNRKVRQRFGLEGEYTSDLTPMRSSRRDASPLRWRHTTDFSPTRSRRHDSSPLRRCHTAGLSPHTVRAAETSPPFQRGATTDVSPKRQSPLTSLTSAVIPRSKSAFAFSTQTHPSARTPTALHPPFAQTAAAAAVGAAPQYSCTQLPSFAPPERALTPDNMGTTSDASDDNVTIPDLTAEDAFRGGAGTIWERSTRWMDGNSVHFHLSTARISRFGLANPSTPSTRESPTRSIMPPKTSVLPSRCLSCGRIRGHLAGCFLLGQTVN
eukprot:GEMP01032106.1.p1 GENE.GEMP01032106.1~~GEMP01032106.1.p1  ORF type:complete len:482 (+),score=95.22 GEMP01032106.1:230-1675(+)